MSIQISEYVNVIERSLQLQCYVPTLLAFLPINFETAETKDELVYEDSITAIRTRLQQAGIQETGIEGEEKTFPTIQSKALEWIIPTLFVSASLFSQDPNLVSVALNVISNYLYDCFKCIGGGNQQVTFNIVTEQKQGKKYKRIHYEGPVDGLVNLVPILQEIQP